jgi:ankyrin repeat protein
LSYCATHAATSSLSVLLSAKASPNMRGSDGNTALHHAVYREHIDAVQLLLQHGAEADALDAGGTASAHWASQGRGMAGSAILACLAEANARTCICKTKMGTRHLVWPVVLGVALF